MSDFGGIGGALLLSDQLSTYRFLDSLSRARHNNDLSVDNAVLRQRFAELVDDYNRLHSQAVAAAKEADRRGAALDEMRRSLADLKAECERLREDNHMQAVDIAFLRKVIRQTDPDPYPPL